MVSSRPSPALQGHYSIDTLQTNPPGKSESYFHRLPPFKYIVNWGRWSPWTTVALSQAPHYFPHNASRLQLIPSSSLKIFGIASPTLDLALILLLIKCDFPGVWQAPAGLGYSLPLISARLKKINKPSPTYGRGWKWGTNRGGGFRAILVAKAFKMEPQFQMFGTGLFLVYCRGV